MNPIDIIEMILFARSLVTVKGFTVVDNLVVRLPFVAIYHVDI